LFLLGVLVYAWFATGVRPFTAPAYLFIAIPSLAALLLYASFGGFSTNRVDVADYYRHRSLHATWRSVAPWIAVAVLAIALETVGLALGGRSPHAPTLSTTVDHLLVDHWERCVLFVVWIAVGARPLRHLYVVRRRSPR
jgi:hypothetical protein